MNYLAKLLERAVYDQVFAYVEENNILPVNQSAYRPDHSTETTLLKIHNDVICSLDRKLNTVIIYLDLSAAFDTIDHGLLISDLFMLGFRGKVLDLLSSYLEGRSVLVSCNGEKSDPRSLLFGVPQGSTMGPLLFSLYTLSLSKLLEDSQVSFQLYADDTQLYFEFDKDHIPEMKTKLNNVLNDISKWMLSRRLKLNMSKTKIMIISPTNQREEVLLNFDKLHYNGLEIFPCTQVKNLGVIFDSKLSFNDQISSVIRRCNFSLFNIKNIKKHISQPLLIKVIHSEILSRIDYCNSLYFQLPKYQLKRMQTIINRAVRIIYSLPYRAHITEYMKDLHWLPLGPRIDFKYILMTHKILNTDNPKYLKDFLTFNSNRQEVSRRLVQHGVSGGHKFGDRAFKYSAPRLYNKIPNDVKFHTENLDLFKSSLKTYLYTEAHDYKLDSILRYNPSNDDYTYNI